MHATPYTYARSNSTRFALLSLVEALVTARLAGVRSALDASLDANNGGTGAPPFITGVAVEAAFAHSPATTDVSDAASAIGAYVERLALRESRFVESVMRGRPDSLAVALMQMYDAATLFEQAVDDAGAAREAHRLADVMSSRVRRNAVKRLMAAPSSMSASAADKAASDDEAYAKHKDHVADLKSARDDAEADERTALFRLLSARAAVNAFTVNDAGRVGAERPESLGALLSALCATAVAEMNGDERVAGDVAEQRETERASEARGVPTA